MREEKKYYYLEEKKNKKTSYYKLFCKSSTRLEGFDFTFFLSRKTKLKENQILTLSKRLFFSLYFISYLTQVFTHLYRLRALCLAAGLHLPRLQCVACGIT